jgi:acyl-homoserine lactone acylase PvdQ
VEGLLFFHGPLPVAVALGWLTARDRLARLHHGMRLARGRHDDASGGGTVGA